MKFSYDRTADAIAITFKKDRIFKDKDISPNTFVGFNKAGEVVELQVLNVSDAGPIYFTVEAAAKLLGKSERTILRWIESGKLRCKKVGKEYRIDPDELDRVA